MFLWNNFTFLLCLTPDDLLAYPHIPNAKICYLVTSICESFYHTFVMFCINLSIRHSFLKYWFSCFLFSAQKEKEKALVDVIFALGSTGRNAREIFEREKNITKHKIDQETFPNTNYALLVYGSPIDTRVHLPFTDNINQTKAAIDSLTWIPKRITKRIPSFGFRVSSFGFQIPNYGF